MGQPKPDVALDGICSVVYNNTLFTYGANAFQSLSLEKGAEWQTLTQGESVTGAACVGSSSGLYVVGGTGGSDGYKGLQKYTYSTGTWESITPVVSVTENRTDHGAVYLEGSDSIVVYAGNQDGDTNDSTQTFSIAASAPYSVLAYENEGAPPTTRPILLAWSDQQAVMVGGSTSNTDVMLFTVGTGWTNSGATLASPLQTGSDPWQATLVTGDDGSKNLYTFDMSVSPNEVNRTVIIDENGAPVSNAVAITRRSAGNGWGEDDVERRATTLTQSDWPTYNSTYASTATRSSYAAADSGDGQVVLSGGNMDDVLCIFNARENSWVNATELLESDQKTLALTSTSSSSSSSTSTAFSSSDTATSTSTAITTSTSESVSSSTSASASVSGSSSAFASASSVLSATAAADTAVAAGNSSSSLTSSSSASSSSAAAASSSSSSGLSNKGVLGATLGSVGGVVVFLVLIYFQIRKRKRRQDFIMAGHARRDSGSSGRPEKDGMALATESYPRSPTNGTFMRQNPIRASAASFSSMAILMGLSKDSSKEGAPRPSMGQRQYNEQAGPPAYAMGQGGPLHPPPTYLAPNGGRDEKGVSFAADTVEPRETLRVPADQQDGMRRSSGWNRYWSGDSAALNILGYGNGPGNGNGDGPGNGGLQANRNTVASEGSHYSTSGRGVDPRHRVTQDSVTVPPLNIVEGRPHFNRVNSASPTVSNFPEDQHRQHLSAEFNDRSTYRQSDVSGYSSGIPASVQENWDPSTTYLAKPWDGSRATSSMYSNAFPMPPTSANRPPMPQFPNGLSQQPQLDKAHTSDMSWLNLGAQHNQQD